jgi:amino acid transporter
MILKNFMNSKILKITVFGLFAFLTFFSLAEIKIASAQDKPLEVNYPQIQGFKPETIATNLPQYVKYIFNFAIAIVGLTAFAVLVYAGLRYVTSTGHPEELKKSRKRILAAILGVLILLFSYLILTTINPQLIVFRLPDLIPAPIPEATTTTPISEVTPDVYEKIRTLVNSLSAAVAGIESQVNSLENLVSQCDCSNAIAACICGEADDSGGGGMNGGGGMEGGGGGF